MLNVNPYERRVVVILQDFFAPETPWTRRLWSVGTCLSLKELLEASEALRASGAGQDNFDLLRKETANLVVRDPGAGDPARRSIIQKSLQSSVTAHGIDYIRVQHLVEDIEANYLSRWARVLKIPKPPDPDFAARCIASHLLDMGFSGNWLRRSLQQLTAVDPAVYSLSDILDHFHGVAVAPVQTFEVFLGFERAPRSRENMPSGWLPANRAVEWLSANGFGRSHRLGGALLHSVPARDHMAAVEQVMEAVDTLSARSALGTSAPIVADKFVRIRGLPDVHKLLRTTRGVQIRALDRENYLYSESRGGNLDNALELIAPLNAGPVAAAVSGGWAAIEALLAAAGDFEKGLAGDRIGTLVACSFPRAELTALSYVHEKQSQDNLSQALAQMRSNAERAKLLAASIQGKHPVVTSRESDAHALQRMMLLLEDPKAKLRSIEHHARMSLRRLYRQRNLVLHAGRTNAVCLRAALRCAAPLIGAGVDRLIHASFVQNLQPLELVARAQVNLELVGQGGAKGVHELLA